MRSLTLLGSVLLATLGTAACSQPTSGTAASGSASASPSGTSRSAAAPPPPATFFVALVADTPDPLANDPVSPRALPKGASIFTEAVPLGIKRVLVPKELAAELCKEEGTCIKDGEASYVEQPDVAERHYFRFVPTDDETLLATRARAERELTSLAPSGTRFYLAPAYEATDAPGEAGPQIGFRTFLVDATPIVGAKDVAEATVEDTHGAIVVMVTLDDAAGARLADATKNNVARRIAVVVGDEVLMSPAIQGPIKGGKLPLGIGKSEDAATAKPEAEVVRATILRAKG